MASYALSSLVARRFAQNKSCLVKNMRIVGNCPLGVFTNPAPTAPVVCRKFSATPVSGSTFYETLARSDSVAFIRSASLSVHEELGMPWWSIVVMSAALVKTLSIPFKIHQSHLLFRRHQVKVEVQNMMPDIKMNVERKQRLNNWSMQEATKDFRRQVIAERRKLTEKYNCHTAKIVILGFAEAPLWILFTSMWRTLQFIPPTDIIASKIFTHQLATEGVPWCPSLFIPDPTFVLPLVVFLTYMSAVELRSVINIPRGSHVVGKIIFVVQRGIAIVLTGVSVFMPSSLCLFWASSGLFALSTELLFMSKRFKDAFAIHPYPDQPHVSYREALKALKKRYGLVK